MNIIEPDRPEDSAYAIYQDLIIEGAISKVFLNITRPEHLVNWWPNTCDDSFAKHNYFHLNLNLNINENRDER